MSWGNISLPYVPAGTAFNTIVPGRDFCLAIESGTGKAIGWGHNDQGQASIPAGTNYAVGVATGASCSLILTLDGSIVLYGNTNAPQANFSGSINEPMALVSVKGSVNSSVLFLILLRHSLQHNGPDADGGFV